MDREAEKDELEKRRKESDEARKARMQKWLGLKQKLKLSKEKDCNLIGLELEQVCSGAREKGDSSCTVRIPAEYPGNQNENMMHSGGNTIFTGERGLGV